ncbi:MAG TPA: amidohydrolase family protein [Burkholderiales bacterium]|nr:amidohydrolase family protein [Burkholderiales bacterium]
MEQLPEERHVRIVDVHHHLTPPTLVARAGKRLPPVYAGFTPTQSIDDMARAGVDLAITSIPSPGIWFGDIEETRRLARECNDHAAAQVADYRGRFGMFATLPLPDIDASLREIEYALDVLRADGVHMWTSYGHRWLGDPVFLPIWPELDRRSAVVFTHPTNMMACLGEFVPDLPLAVIEYGTDTCRTIASLVFGGVTAQFPNVRFIFPHAGGTMPYLVERFVYHAQRLDAERAARLPHGVLAELRKLHFDVAQSANRHALSSLMQLVAPSQVLLGTDFPQRSAHEHRNGLRACGLFSMDDLVAIEGGNALRLMPRLGAASR